MDDGEVCDFRSKVLGSKLSTRFKLVLYLKALLYLTRSLGMIAAESENVYRNSYRCLKNSKTNLAVIWNFF